MYLYTWQQQNPKKQLVHLLYIKRSPRNQEKVSIQKLKCQKIKIQKIILKHL
jgi:hypothetical protein